MQIMQAVSRANDDPLDLFDLVLDQGADPVDLDDQILDALDRIVERRLSAKAGKDTEYEAA